MFSIILSGLGHDHRLSQPRHPRSNLELQSTLCSLVACARPVNLAWALTTLLQTVGDP